MLGEYEFTQKHRFAIKNHLLTGITILPWLHILKEHSHDIEWSKYWHRVIFLTIISLINSFLSIPDRLFFRHIDKSTETTLHPSPVFIIGHPRTGTTHLHNLLALDPRFSVCRTFHCGFPSSFLSLDHAFIKRLLSVVIDDTRPMDAMPLSFKTPSEDEIAINVLSGGISPYNCLVFPKQYKHYLKYLTFEDATTDDAFNRWQTSMLSFFKKVSYQQRGKPLVIKSPVHAGRLDYWLKLFPKAKFIFVHRHPYEVFSSSCHLSDTYGWYCCLQTPTNAEVTDYVLDQGRIIHEKYLSMRSEIPSDQLVEVSFDDLLTRDNLLSTLKSIYDQFEWDGFEDYSQQVTKYYEQQNLQKFVMNNHKPLIEAQKKLIAERWGFWALEFGYYDLEN